MDDDYRLPRIAAAAIAALGLMAWGLGIAETASRWLAYKARVSS